MPIVSCCGRGIRQIGHKSTRTVHFQLLFAFSSRNPISPLRAKLIDPLSKTRAPNPLIPAIEIYIGREKGGITTPRVKGRAEYHRCLLLALDTISTRCPEISHVAQDHTFLPSNFLRGLDFGVEVKTAYCSGRWSGESERCIGT